MFTRTANESVPAYSQNWFRRRFDSFVQRYT